MLSTASLFITATLPPESPASEQRKCLLTAPLPFSFKLCRNADVAKNAAYVKHVRAGAGSHAGLVSPCAVAQVAEVAEHLFPVLPGLGHRSLSLSGSRGPSAYWFWWLEGPNLQAYAASQPLQQGGEAPQPWCQPPTSESDGS